MKVTAFCIFRDSEKHLPRLFKQLEDLETLLGFDFEYYFYENDSKDNTVEMLTEWLKDRKGAFLSEQLNAPKFGRSVSPARMAQLCYCRNKGKSLCEDFGDLSIIFDSDVEFSLNTFHEMLNFYNEHQEVVMVTPNVVQNLPDYTFGTGDESYYDVYPYRDKYGQGGLYFSSSPCADAQDRSDWWSGHAVRVLSAFGGFVILDSEAFKQCDWSSGQHCDHVNLCMELAKFGHIYVLPWVKTRVELDLDTLDLADFKKNAVRQLEFVKNLEELKKISTGSTLDINELTKFL